MSQENLRNFHYSKQQVDDIVKLLKKLPNEQLLSLEPQKSANNSEVLFFPKENKPVVQNNDTKPASAKPAPTKQEIIPPNIEIKPAKPVNNNKPAPEKPEAKKQQDLDSWLNNLLG